jgi:hypothetical protein
MQLKLPTFWIPSNVQQVDSSSHPPRCADFRDELNDNQEWLTAILKVSVKHILNVIMKRVIE